MKEQLKNRAKTIGWTELVVGILLTTLAGPFIGPAVTHVYEGVGIYDGPNVETSIEKTGEYYPPGEPVEEFGGLPWNESYEVYRIEIGNTNQRPVDRVKLTWRAPGCIVESNTEEEMIYGQYWLHNRFSLDISSKSKLVTNKMQCTKVLEMTDASLGKSERLAVEFVVTRDFNECDVLVDSNPVNQHELMYRWSVEGVQFSEERMLSPSSLEDEYSDARNVSFVGTRERFVTESGFIGQNYVVGKRGGSLNESSGSVALQNRTRLVVQ